MHRWTHDDRCAIKAPYDIQRSVPAFIACILAATLVACTAGARVGPPVRADERTTAELSHHFRSFGADGAFVLYDASAGRLTIHGQELATRRFLPASTFKILNSLIALEVGVVADEHEIIPWDGVDRGDWWNGDQPLTRAFQRSSVWVYQELARRVGEERMQEWVARVGYGNGDIAGGIDRFWLEGALRISAEEQIDFLRKLQAGTLPFSERTHSIVWDLMLFAEGDGWIMRGKTGWSRVDGMQRGWLVGWVERGTDVFFYATLIDSQDAGVPMQRAQREITRGALRELGVLPPGPAQDRGIGVVGFGRGGPDTLRVRAAPSDTAALVAELRQPRDGPYELVPREIRPNLVEYAYEVQGIPFDSTSGPWARVIYGSRLDETPARGWVLTGAAGIHRTYWRDLLPGRSARFLPGTRAELFNSPAGGLLDLSSLRRHIADMYYELIPVRAEGEWLLVRVLAPSSCGEHRPAVDTTAWIRYIGADGRPLIHGLTRGC